VGGWTTPEVKRIICGLDGDVRAEWDDVWWSSAGVYAWHRPWCCLALVLCTMLAILAWYWLPCLSPGMPASRPLRLPTTSTQTSSCSWVLPMSASPTTHPRTLLMHTRSHFPISTSSIHLQTHSYHHPHSTHCRISRLLPLVC